MTLLLLVHATYIWVLFFAHIQFVANCAFSTSVEWLQQHPSIFTQTAPIAHFFVKVSHGTTFTTWLQHHFFAIGKPAKLHTVTASNNRDHAPRSLYCCLFVPHGVVLHAHSVHGKPRIQHNACGEGATLGTTVCRQTQALIFSSIAANDA